MAENILYADLNLPESTRPRTLKVPDVPGCTYAEVKVKSQDTNDTTNCKSSGKSHCSRRRFAVLVAVLVVIILALALVVCRIILYGPAAGSQQDSTIPEEALGCPPKWKKHGRKCYFFSPEEKLKDWNAFSEECAGLGSELVIIDSREELSYLLSQSRSNYYLLGLRFSEEEHKWKWINNVEYDPNMFNISGKFRDYQCMVIGFGEVQTAPCGGSRTTQNMCEKAATVSARLQKES